MAGAAGRVVFDFEGSLQLARQLWSFAEDLRSEAEDRESEGEKALEKWEGPYSTEFEGRRSDEMSSRLLVVSDLKEGAKAWALAWKKALDQQNQNNRQQKLEQMKEDRNWGQKLWDNTLGSDPTIDDVSGAPDVPVPSPPGFAATATETTF